MERLTLRDENGKAWAELDAFADAERQMEFGRIALNRLAAYEDTGLMPNEIGEMKSLCGNTYNDLRYRLRKAEEELMQYHKSQKEPSKLISDDLVPPSVSDADMVTSTVRRIDGYVRNFKGLSTDQWRRIKAILDEGEKHETD